ncbi:MAG: hypothetical protein P8184_18095, partial [Calditrichia bacterium]
RILKNYQEKYLFQVKENHLPVDKVVIDDRLAGLVFARTMVKGDRLTVLPGSTTRIHSPLVISSIGSIPEPLPNISARGDFLAIRNADTGEVEGHDSVFALGNAVTGRGNIKESQTHGRQVSEKIIRDFLEWENPDSEGYDLHEAKETSKRIRNISDQIEKKRPLPAEKIHSIIQHIRAWQQRAGYDGDYSAWITKHRPVRLEEMLQNSDIRL